MNANQRIAITALRACDSFATYNTARNVWLAARKIAPITQREITLALAALARRNMIERRVALTASNKTNFPRKVAYYSLPFLS